MLNSDLTAGHRPVHRPDIDGLRAVAVLSVVFYHLGIPGFTGGFGGVDVFFVISGFLIAGIIKREIEARTFSLVTFYERRIRRIFPALLAVMAVSTALAYWIFLPLDFREFGSSLLGVATMTSNFYFMRKTGYFDAAADEKPLLHTWSLSVEEQFYIVFPILLLLLYRRGRAVAVSVLALMAVASLVASWRSVEIAPARAFFESPGRMWELLIGVLTAFMPAANFVRRTVREITAAAGLALILSGVFLYSDATVFPGPSALVFCLGAALILHAGKEDQETLVGKLLSLPPMTGVGLISYSLYLWHWPVLAFARYRYADMFAVEGRPDLSIRVGLLLVSLSLAYVSWRFIEQRFRKPHGPRQRRQAYHWFAGLTALMVAVSVGIVKNKGLPGRWPPEVVALMNDSVQRSRSGCAQMGPDAGWPQTVCRLGPADVRDEILVWGDSHAGYFIQPLAAEAERRRIGIVVAAIGGCPPFANIAFFGRSKASVCRQLADAAMHHIGDGRFRDVILTARWAYYADGTRFGGETGQPILLSPSGIDKNAEVFARLFVDTVRDIVARGAHVTIIASIPEQRFLVSAATARHRIWGQALPAPVSRLDFDRRQRNVTPVLESLSAIDGVRILYPRDILCDRDVCRYQSDHWPLYTDTNHLSVKGLSMLAPLISDALSTPSAGHAK